MRLRKEIEGRKQYHPMSPSKAKDELDEFEAAALVGMSPRLLRWLAKYAPKQEVSRKLKIRKDGERIFVQRSELLGFDDWLKLPWPSKKDARPPVPNGIQREIKEEASGECAICLKNGNSCEAAHINPVAKSKNNHPENLIWLCANHHTKFDHGGYGPSADAKDFVVSFKQSLTYYRRGLWQFQAEVTGQLFTMLKACDSLNAQLAAAKTPEQVAAVKSLAKKAVVEVGKLAPTSKHDPDYAAFVAMKPQFDALAGSSTKSKHVGATLKLASDMKTEFARRAGYEACPLCKGNGHYKHEDCPACGGEGELKAYEIRELDLDRYGDVSCPLCKGKGAFNGDDCPACDGEGQMERRFADQVDPREWDEVSCNLCEGTGKWKHGACPVCDGSGKLERHQRDQVDIREYALVDCPLCKGKGTFRGEDCPECHGEQQMERRYADQVDVRQYESEDCFICEGSGEWYGMPCHACGGEGRLERWQAEQVDRSDFKMVACPACKGDDSDFCRTCDGEGEVPRYIADRF
ncbi:zinc finger domain-containing protein [Rhizobium sp. FKL33]|uniref:zinc finger domain-containing protein n=1 Tax=Rhizobium sp. FKL33 TaxID=2562307 RepID=UPI0019814A37|nr:zinc finger domain-containing protein [Rhizobium sp. FKL33]